MARKELYRVESIQDDISDLVSKTEAGQVITGQLTLNPTGAPFLIGVNAEDQLVSGLNADQLDGLEAAAFQLADGDLTALAALASTGFMVRTGGESYATRTLQGTTNQVNVSNGDGVAGDPVLSLPQDIHTGATVRFANINVYGAGNPRVRVAEGASTTSYTSIEDTSPSRGLIEKVANSGLAQLDMNPNPSDGTSDSLMRFFRAVNTTGTKAFQFYKGDGTATIYHSIGSAVVVFNEQGEDIDFRVEGNTNINLLLVDAGLDAIGIARPTPSGAKLVVGTGTTWGKPVLELDQDDSDQPFTNYAGTSAANADNSITTWTTGNSVQGHIRVQINGVTRWIRFYDAPTS